MFNYRIWFFVFIAHLVGCTSAPRLMPTPNLYIGERGYPEAEVQLAQKSSQVDLLYVTDRLPDPEKNQLEYGSGRSTSLAFGLAVVDTSCCCSFLG